jgi:CubicO group peptidase (beta-lactamase class C family)
MKNNQVIWNKAYGYHTYAKKKSVTTTDLYDIASITKTVATLPALMKLESEGKISADGTLGMYLPDLVQNTSYAQLTIREILTHNAGLKSWIPFYLHTIENGVPRYDVYSTVQNETYPTQVANGLYIHKTYADSMMQLIINTPLKDRGEYRYSDLGYYFMQEIVERKTGTTLDQYVQKNFYQPMGMWSTMYKPMQRFDTSVIVPTENDTYFRNQQVKGMVHDPGAAMLGGVGGHAGVFSNALDLAKIWQMYLDSGMYGGHQYLTPEVLAEYEKCQYCMDSTSENRRGIGFDKPVRDGGSGPTCGCVDYKSFGHTGFTGTIAWADPTEQLVYVFLSNRVYPTAENKKLITLNVRTDIMQTIYDAMHDSSYNNMAVIN